jgi:hypothetical protein
MNATVTTLKKASHRAQGEVGDSFSAAARPPRQAAAETMGGEGASRVVPPSPTSPGRPVGHRALLDERGGSRRRFGPMEALAPCYDASCSSGPSSSWNASVPSLKL